MLTNDERKELQEDFDARYVRHCTCQQIQTENNKKFANDDKRIDLQEHDFKILTKLVWIIATATVGQLIATVFEKLF